MTGFVEIDEYINEDEFANGVAADFFNTSKGRVRRPKSSVELISVQLELSRLLKINYDEKTMYGKGIQEKLDFLHEKEKELSLAYSNELPKIKEWEDYNKGIEDIERQQLIFPNNEDKC